MGNVLLHFHMCPQQAKPVKTICGSAAYYRVTITRGIAEVNIMHKYKQPRKSASCDPERWKFLFYQVVNPQACVHGQMTPCEV